MSDKSHLRSAPTAARSASSHTGKVLAFPIRASVAAAATNAIAARSRGHKHHLPDWVGVTLWCAFAWTMAVLRVRLAAARHEVFGLDATLAFLVAVVLPLLCVRPLVRNARAALQWLRSPVD